MKRTLDGWRGYRVISLILSVILFGCAARTLSPETTAGDDAVRALVAELRENTAGRDLRVGTSDWVLATAVIFPPLCIVIYLLAERWAPTRSLKNWLKGRSGRPSGGRQ